MSVVGSIADFFKSGEGETKPVVGQYNFLAPFLAVKDCSEQTQSFLKIVTDNPATKEVLTGRTKLLNKFTHEATKAYDEFVKGLPNHLQGDEKKSPLSSLTKAFASISKNFEMIEDHYTEIFGFKNDSFDEENLKVSALVVTGYVETVDAFCNWVASLCRHLTDDGHDPISPFETKTLHLKASDFGSFVGFCNTVWDEHGGLLDDIRKMQKKGVDVVLKSGDQWIDTFVSDAQYSDQEKTLMTASMANPIMMFVRSQARRHDAKLSLLSERKEWLISKVAMEEKRLQGVDPESADFKKMRATSDHYANLVSRYEQQLERMRA